jgi:putative transposase
MTTTLQLDTIYHIYQRGNNRQRIFFRPDNYRHFLHLYSKYILPVAQTYAYCLLPNHVHFALRTYSEAEQRVVHQQTCEVLETSQVSPFKLRQPSRQFAHLFNAYAKGINKQEQRSGGLYEGRFGRKPISSARYIHTLIRYIHHNPQRHGLVEDFRDWPYSSYTAYLSDKPTKLARATVLDWFGGVEGFVVGQKRPLTEAEIAALFE